MRVFGRDIPTGVYDDADAAPDMYADASERLPTGVGDDEAPETSADVSATKGSSGSIKRAVRPSSARTPATHPMKTQYYTATSLDGFIATEDDSLDWLFPLGDLDNSSYPAFISEVGALAMGSATYEWMLRNADAVVAETGTPWPYTQPTWVFTSRKLPAIEGADVRFVNGDVRAVHAEMQAAAGSRNIWIVGGGDLAGQFYDAGLLDELIIQIGSATLGDGKPLFPRRVLSPVLRLVSVQQLGAGMVELRYEVDNGATDEAR